MSLIHIACEGMERVDYGNGLGACSGRLLGIQEVIICVVELGLSPVSMISWDRNMRKGRYGTKHTQLFAA